MTFKLVCITNAVLTFGFGIAFIVAAGTIAPMYGMTLTPGGLLLVRLLGAAFIGFGVICFQARDAADSPARRAIALGIVVGNALGAVIALLGVTSGAQNSLGWLSVALYAILAAGFGMTGLAKSSD